MPIIHSNMFTIALVNTFIGQKYDRGKYYAF